MTQPLPQPSPEPDAAAPGRVGVVVAAGIAAVALLALAVVVPVLLVEPSEGPGHGVLARPGAGADGTADLDEVRIYRDLPRDHTDAEVDYPQVPPAGGPHDPAWLDCGARDEPVRDENAVHDLEHGTVWITHDPALPGEDVELLEGLLPANGILSPYPGLPAPVVVTVWGRQLLLTGADDPRLPLFIAAFGDGHTAPEPFASCAGGLPGTGLEPGGVAV